jgi:hypothetical protein
MLSGIKDVDNRRLFQPRGYVSPASTREEHELMGREPQRDPRLVGDIEILRGKPVVLHQRLEIALARLVGDLTVELSFPLLLGHIEKEMEEAGNPRVHGLSRRAKSGGRHRPVVT